MMEMKKMILLLTVLGTSLLMTSCLGEGSRNYAESSVAYIALDNTTGKTFGRTLTGKFIISTEMQLMQPGTFKFLTYSWDEEYGTTPIDGIQVDNVRISGDPLDVNSTNLHMSEAPAQEDPRKFVGIDPPYFANDEVYLGDHWLFQYAYESIKGETAVVNFYKIEDSGADANEVKIEIQLDIIGTPDAGASITTKTDVIALDMAPLRAMYEGTSPTSTKELKITFQYYMKNRTEPVDSQIYRMTVAGD